MLLKEINKNINILNIINLCKKKYGVSKLYNGNCGQFAYALAKFLITNNESGVQLALITNDFDDEKDLWENDPDVYHVCLSYKNKLYDGDGIVTKIDLLNLAKNEYGDMYPVQWNLDMNENARRAISYNTKWNIEWVEFYKFINSL